MGTVYFGQGSVESTPANGCLQQLINRLSEIETRQLEIGAKMSVLATTQVALAREAKSINDAMRLLVSGGPG